MRQMHGDCVTRGAPLIGSQTILQAAPRECR